MVTLLTVLVFMSVYIWFGLVIGSILRIRFTLKTAAQMYIENESVWFVFDKMAEHKIVEYYSPLKWQNIFGLRHIFFQYDIPIMELTDEMLQHEIVYLRQRN